MENKTITPETIAMQSTASKDRLNMKGVNFNDNHIVATDGHCLSIRKTRSDDTLRGNYELSGKTKRFIVPLNPIKPDQATERLICDDVQVKAYSVPESEFPDYIQVIPQAGERSKITFNLCLLLKVAKAMELKGREQIITIAFKDELSPIEITSCDSDTAGIVMPINPDYVTVKTFQQVVE